MKHHLLLTTAAIALSIAVAPALAQTEHNRKSVEQQQRQDRNDSAQKVKRSTTGQSAQDENRHDRQINRADQQKSGSAGQAASDRDQHRTARDQQPATRDGATERRSAEQDKSTAQPRSSNSNDSGRTATNPNQNRNSARSAEPNRASPSAERHRDSAQSNDRHPANDQRKAAQRDDNRRTGISASLDPQHRERLHTAFARLNVDPVNRVDFSISVGTAVPSHVRLRPVPAAIIEVVPQYRGYDFFVVRDEVVIVEPRTHKIVDVIQRTPSHARAQQKDRVTLSDKQRNIIRKHVTSRRTVTTTGTAPGRTVIEIGETLPESVQIESFPAEVYTEVPEIRSYRYIERGDNVYLVDPGSRTVIEEVR